MGFDCHDQNGIQIVVLPAFMNAELSRELELAMKQWLLKPEKVYVFHFKNVKKMDRSLYRLFIAFNNNVKKVEKAVSYIGVSDSLLQQFGADGVSGVFRSVELKKAMGMV